MPGTPPPAPANVHSPATAALPVAPEKLTEAAKKLSAAADRMSGQPAAVSDQPPPKQPAQAGAVEDAGEKLGGARKDQVPSAARAFENYVIAKLQREGYHNDYLANVVSVEEFARAAGRYPYLLENEIAPVAEAFDNLFATIQTRETVKGVELYQEQPIDLATEERRGREAVERALRTRQDVPTVFESPVLGPVSLVWGEAGQYDRNRHIIRGGHGLAKTVQLAELEGLDGVELARWIPGIVLRGELGPFYGPADGVRVNAVLGADTVVLSLHQFGERKAWGKTKGPASAATVNAAADYAPPATGMSPAEGAGSANVGRDLPEVKRLHELAKTLDYRVVNKVTPPNPQARGAGGAAPVMVNGKPVTAADVRGTFPEPTTIKHDIDRALGIGVQQQIDLSTGNETVVYRGETVPPKAVRVVPTGLMDGSELSQSVYPYVRVELDNGSAFYLQVRISNHANYYIPYSVDVSRFTYADSPAGLQRAAARPTTALSPGNWPAVEAEILRQLNQPASKSAFAGYNEGGYVAQVWNRQRDLIEKGAEAANAARPDYEMGVNAWRVIGVAHDPLNPRRRVIVRSRDVLQRKRGLNRYLTTLVEDSGSKVVRTKKRDIYDGNRYEDVKRATLETLGIRQSPLFEQAEDRGILYQEAGERSLENQPAAEANEGERQSSPAVKPAPDLAELERQISAARFSAQSAMIALDRAGQSNVELRNNRARYHKHSDRAFAIYRQYKATGDGVHFERVKAGCAGGGDRLRGLAVAGDDDAR